MSQHHDTPSNTSPQSCGFSGLELWCANLNAATSSLLEGEEKTPRLPQCDLDFAAAIADKRRANEWLAAHIALRILLERAVGRKWRGTPFVRAAGEKPYLAGAPVTFSLSHVPGWSLMGVGKVEPLGVDLERKRALKIRALRRAMLERAAEALSAEACLPDQEDARALQAWVRLEAFAKADGRGIGRLLTQLGILGESGTQGDDLQKRVDDVRRGLPLCTVHDLSIGEGLFAAAALPAGARLPQILRFPSSTKGVNELLG